jgi:hypothetical protein
VLFTNQDHARRDRRNTRARVPDAVRRSPRRAAEPGPTGTRGPRISSAPPGRCAASGDQKPLCRSQTEIPRGVSENLCPGRGAAFFTPHRRAGTHRQTWTPDQQRTARALRSIRGTGPDAVHKLSSSVKSRQFGFSFSIRAIFQARRQRFKECSRARASRTVSNDSK